MDNHNELITRPSFITENNLILNLHIYSQTNLCVDPNTRTCIHSTPNPIFLYIKLATDKASESCNILINLLGMLYPVFCQITAKSLFSTKLNAGCRLSYDTFADATLSSRFSLYITAKINEEVGTEAFREDASCFLV